MKKHVNSFALKARKKAGRRPAIKGRKVLDDGTETIPRPNTGSRNRTRSFRLPYQAGGVLPHAKLADFGDHCSTHHSSNDRFPDLETPSRPILVKEVCNG